MIQAKLPSTTGLAIVCFLIVTSCNYVPQVRQQQQDYNAPKLTPDNASISNRVIKTLSSDRVTNVAAKTTVFDDVPQDLDNARADLLTDTAKLLAGMNISDRSELALLEDTQFLSNHRRFLGNAWSKLEVSKLLPMRQWSQQELDKIDTSQSTVFYPFSNANFLQAYSFFPQAQEYILVGLAPVGSVDNLAYLSETKQARKLKEVRTYLDSLFPADYFQDIYVEEFKDIQALPVLYVFLAKTNNRIIDVEYISINAKGQAQKIQQGMISGVKITFVTQGDTKPRFLYYFAADLSNDGAEQNPELVKFLENRNSLLTYLDRAAYLMYFDSYSQVKELILSRSSYLLQNDSGLPLEAFDSEQWSLQFYGNYTQPIDLFQNKYQPELWNIYHSQENIQPLTFSIGYQSEVESSNLMLAIPKPQS